MQDNCQEPPEDDTLPNIQYPAPLKRAKMSIEEQQHASSHIMLVNLFGKFKNFAKILKLFLTISQLVFMKSPISHTS